MGIFGNLLKKREPTEEELAEQEAYKKQMKIEASRIGVEKAKAEADAKIEAFRSKTADKKQSGNFLDKISDFATQATSNMEKQNLFAPSQDWDLGVGGRPKRVKYGND